MISGGMAAARRADDYARDCGPLYHNRYPELT